MHAFYSKFLESSPLALRAIRSPNFWDVIFKIFFLKSIYT